MQRLLAPRAAAAAAVPSSAARPRRQPSLRKRRARSAAAATAAAAAVAAAPQAPLTVLERLARSLDGESSPLATAVEPPSSREAEVEADSAPSSSSSPSPTPTPPENDDDDEVRAASPPAPKPKGSSFYANVGTAVRTIREDLPALFQRDMDCESGFIFLFSPGSDDIDPFPFFLFLAPLRPRKKKKKKENLTPPPAHPALLPPQNKTKRNGPRKKKTKKVSIYRDDVVFRDPRNAFHGIANYRTIFWSVRFHGNLFFTNLRVDVSRVWQPEPREIRVRWSARGESRLPWRPVGVFDGISTFRLDEEGMIYVHEVNNVVLRPPPGMRSPLSPLFARLNLVPELEGVVQGVPSGGGGACPGWRGEAAGGRRAAPLSAAAASLLRVEERPRLRRRGSPAASPPSLPPSSLPSCSSSSSAAAEESVLVLGQEASHSYLTRRGEGKEEKGKEEERREEGREREEAVASLLFVCA